MFGIESWRDMELYHYLAIGGGGLAVIALVLYFVLPKGTRLPLGVLSTFAALAAGVGVGVIGMAAFGYAPHRATPPEGMDPGPGMPQKGGPNMGGPPGMPGMPPGGPGAKGGGKGKGGGPSPKMQLVVLVTKLHQLTDKPLTLNLTEEKRKAISAQLKDLIEQDEVTDDDAKKRLDGLLEALKDDRATLEAAGYRFPGAGGGGPGGAAPPAASNPFKVPENREPLTKLQSKLGKE